MSLIFAKKTVNQVHTGLKQKIAENFATKFMPINLFITKLKRFLNSVDASPKRGCESMTS